MEDNDLIEFQNLKEANEYINKDKKEFDKNPMVAKLLEDYKKLGQEDHIFPFCEEDYFMFDDISKKTKRKKINDLSDDDEEDIDIILELCELIASCNESEITEDDKEVIEEYRAEKMKS